MYKIKKAVQRRKAEKALQGSEEKFQLFVEEANEIVFSVTPDTIFSYVSPKWSNLLGYDFREIISKPVKDFIHPEDFSRILDLFVQIRITRQKKKWNRISDLP